MASDIRDASTERLELTAYRLHRSPSEIVCAAPSREWMDATDERYAYRCLPLLIANQAGWLVLNDRPIECIWNGTSERSGVRIRGLDKRASTAAVTSHFGSGIVTWHIPFLFRTSPGYNLLVRGPSNWPKDGVQALEGLVESDWTPATFTMNWKITRPRRWVRFEAGEPVCMLVPQRRGELEAFEAQMRDLGSNPELSDAHRRWSESRAHFLAKLEVNDEAAVSRKWQKDYFQGRAPGTDGEHRQQHQTVLKLRPFTPFPPLTSPGEPESAMKSTAAKPRPKPDYRIERLDGEILLYHPASTKVMYLNETASLIWRLCDGTRTTADIAGLLQEAFPEQAATIADEVESTLRRFVEQDALELL